MLPAYRSADREGVSRHISPLFAIGSEIMSNQEMRIKLAELIELHDTLSRLDRNQRTDTMRQIESILWDRVESLISELSNSKTLIADPKFTIAGLRISEIVCYLNIRFALKNPDVHLRKFAKTIADSLK